MVLAIESFTVWTHLEFNPATTTFSTSSSRGTPTSSTGGADLLSFGASGVTALAVITRDAEVLRPWVVAATPVVLVNSSPWKDLAST